MGLLLHFLVQKKYQWKQRAYREGTNEASNLKIISEQCFSELNLLSNQMKNT